MAKAGGNTNTTWILLRDARALAIEAYDGAVKKAEDLLTEWLGDGRVRWYCKLFEPASDPAALNRGADAAGLWFLTGVAYSEGDPAFWRTSLNINWEENWAHEMYVVGGNQAHGIKVAREDLLALLPREPSEYAEAAASGASKEWIAAEVRQMKTEGNIPSTISELARKLEQRMNEAADADRSIRRLKWRSIRNMLRESRIWPVTRTV